VKKKTIQISVLVDGRPATGCWAKVEFRLKDGGSTSQDRLIGSSGRCRVSYDETQQKPSLLVVAAVGYWTVRQPDPGDKETVHLDRLPTNGPLGWWHKAVGIRAHERHRGRNIRIGVIDTGTNDHECLRHVKNLGSFQGVYHDPADGFDSWGHGTHVCGIIGARPQGAHQFAGLAPGANLMTVRAMSRENDQSVGESSRIRQTSLAEAIEFLAIEKQVDLINISLGSEKRSDFVLARLQEAFDAGTLCICASGNAGNVSIHFPASCSEAVAVSALGHKQANPCPEHFEPSESGKFGKFGYFLLGSSNFGPGIDACAPGMSVISCAASDPAGFVEMTGTSMAAPVVTGLLAAVLSEDSEYLAADRTVARAQIASDRLFSICADVGLDPQYQGKGMPCLTAP